MPSFYIAPNSIIVLLRDVPIDQTQEHTLWFANAEDQANYFYNKQAITLTQQYYVRQGRGVIKVEANADRIYDCNYMMFKNISFGNKWFYAFITSIEYTNNNTATVTFTIDQLQTWLFEMRLGQCFIEREHAATDTIGENIVPENLETGEYFYSNMQKIDAFDTLYIVLAVTEWYDTTQNKFVPVSGYAQHNTYNGVMYRSYDFNAAGVAEVNAILDKYTEDNKADAVVSIFMCPGIILAMANTPGGIAVTYRNRPDNLNGYVPRNNKLFTAPYMSILVKTPGNAAEYGWEYFYSLAPAQFVLYTNLSTSPSAMLCPFNYKTSVGIYDNATVPENYVEAITLNGWPQCSYNIDTFKAWIAQNGPTIYVNSALAGLGLGASIVTGNIAGAVGSIGTIANLVTQTIQHSTLPPQARGETNGNISLSSGVMNFLFFTKTIGFEFAQIIDQFFDKFGYATHKIKIPNIHVRQYWTYTKTVDCIIHGNLPTESITEIQDIFNHGITFWADPSVVGNYSLRNYPLEVP